jgi:hypothetical protein
MHENHTPVEYWTELGIAVTPRLAKERRKAKRQQDAHGTEAVVSGLDDHRREDSKE